MISTLTLLSFLDKDDQKEQRLKDMIRHQNPRMNRPGVKPALPPRRIQAAAAAKVTKTPMDAKDRPDDGIPLKSKIPAPARPARRPGDSLNCPFIVDDIPKVVIRIPSTPPPVAPTDGVFPYRDAKLTTAIINNPPSAPTKRKFSDRDVKLIAATTKKPTPSALQDLSRLRPSLPYRRMHYIRRLGEGGEGYCDLFRLQSPCTLLVVKTFKETPQLVCPRKHGEHGKPLEAHILQDILGPHPRILRLHDYVCNKRATMMFYEYCEFNTLQEVVENYWAHEMRVPESFIWHCFLQLAEALAYIHTGVSTIRGVPSINHHPHFKPITHRDIKPENIFLRKPSPGSNNHMPDVALADWGLATHPPGNSDPGGHPVGTLQFQGPEVPVQTRESDLWALGATVHCLVHGYSPIGRRPRGVSEEMWLWDGGSRQVTSATSGTSATGASGKGGYSEALDTVMKAVLREEPGMRLGGVRLVEAVKMGRKCFLRGVGKGREEGMQSWAFNLPKEEGRREGQDVLEVKKIEELEAVAKDTKAVKEKEVLKERKSRSPKRKVVKV